MNVSVGYNFDLFSNYFVTDEDVRHIESCTIKKCFELFSKIEC